MDQATAESAPSASPRGDPEVDRLTTQEATACHDISVATSARETLAAVEGEGRSVHTPPHSLAISLTGTAGEGEEVSASQEALQNGALLAPWAEQLSILSHLAFFAQIGVIVRMLLVILFGPSHASVTGINSALFTDLPPNVLGSFIMGIVGFSMKKNIAEFSQPLAIGLSTGLCGSITTFASWNQRLVATICAGHVLTGLCGYFVGAAAAYYSFLLGADTSDAIWNALEWCNRRRMLANKPRLCMQPEHYTRRVSSLVVFAALSCSLWIVAGVLFAFKSVPVVRAICLAVIVGPPGCWIRWWLSPLNGKGIGREAHFKWLPLGTLYANLLAVVLEASISAVDSVHDTPWGSLVVGALQAGLMGCMSTVSTLMVEVHSLREGKGTSWRSYVYLYVVSIGISLVIGIITYGIPVWVYGTASLGYNTV